MTAQALDLTEIDDLQLEFEYWKRNKLKELDKEIRITRSKLKVIEDDREKVLRRSLDQGIPFLDL